MLSVGLTGSVGSGKSTVARIWAEAGVPVVSADDLARKAVEPGTRGLKEVVAAFGEGVLSEGGTLDRKALGSRVFRDAGERRKLEQILHPRIRELRDAWLERQRSAGAPLVVSEIPLLFETGLESDFDVTVLVDAPADVRLQRVMQSRELDEDEARRIMEAQADDAVKRERADVVLDNEGGLQDLKVRALALLDLLRGRAVGDRRREEA